MSNTVIRERISELKAEANDLQEQIDRISEEICRLELSMPTT